MNKKFLPVLLLAGFLSVALFSCQKHKDNPYANDYSQGYFPLSFGQYVIYNVDSTIWIDTSCKVINRSYQMRYSVIDTMRDDHNNKIFQINVEVRKQADTSAFKLARVVFVTDTNNMIQYVENNLRFIKLEFPVVNNLSWLGNSLIDVQDANNAYFQNWVYNYSNYQQPYNNGLLKFDNTVTVMETDQLQGDTINQRSLPAYQTFAKEVYAYNVGLVYREMTHWNYNPNYSSMPPDTCIKGYRVIMRAVDHN